MNIFDSNGNHIGTLNDNDNGGGFPIVIIAILMIFGWISGCVTDCNDEHEKQKEAIESQSSE